MTTSFSGSAIWSLALHHPDHVHLQRQLVVSHRGRTHHDITFSLVSSSFSSSRPQNAKIANLTSQLIASSSSSIAASRRSDSDTDAPDDDELFAELEAEIENDDGPRREQGLKELQREYGKPLLFVAVPPMSNK